MAGSPGITIAHTYTKATGSVKSATLTVAPSPGDLEVAIVYGYNTAGQCYALTVPTGWTEYDSTCSSNKRHTLWTLSHVAGSSDTSYTFTVSNDDYLSVVVYDLKGAAGIEHHTDANFTSTTGTQTTASISSSTDYDLAIASWANANYASPTVQSPYTHDADANQGVYLTTGHLMVGTAQSTSATATYASGYPADSGETNLLLISPSVNLAHPVAAEVAMTCSGGGCLPGNGTSTLLWGVEASGKDSVPACTGNCQPFNNVVLNDCNSYNPSVTRYANANGHETDFTHTDATNATRWSYTSESTGCAGFPKLLNASDTVNPLLNYSAAQTKSDVATVVTPAYIPTGGIFSDGHSFDYDAALNSYEICNGCGHTWIAGGSAKISLLQNFADETNALSQYRVWLNSLGNVAGGTGGGCTTIVSGHCYGDKYNNGTYDNRVRLDEFCNNLTGNNFTAIRQEQALTGDNNAQGGQYLGIGLSVLLDTVYAMRSLPHCGSAVLVAEETYPAQSAHAWIPGALAALQAMAPSADGTPDEIVQQPYAYCNESSCTNDTNIWPEMFIVPYGPKFTVTPYQWASTTTPHSATFCPGAGSPSSQYGDRGGIQPLVLTCVAKDQPVLAAPYQHCYFLDHDLGACEWILNTGTSAATINESGKGYGYVVNFAGCEFGTASRFPTGSSNSTIATMFPWISSSSSLYSAMGDTLNANTQSACDNGSLSFSSTLPTSVAANNAVLLVASKPAGY